MPQNNFTILRLILATLVVFGHFKVLPGLPSAYSIHAYADFAVDAFFIISGYLVYGSFDNSPQLKGFYIKRFFRIYPLLAIAIFIQAIIMIFLLGGKAEFMDSAKYIFYNLAFATFKQNDIGGLFDSLHTDGINPSLWTLKIEAMFYIVTPFVWMLVQRFGVKILGLIFLASTAYYAFFDYKDMHNLAKQLPGQMRFFAVGMYIYFATQYKNMPSFYFYMMGDKPCKICWWLSAILLFTICTFRAVIPIMAIYPILVGALVYIIVLRLPVVKLKYDISYGVYLIHAPIIQLSILLGLYQDNYLFLSLVVILVYILAFLSEKFIEMPMVRLGKKYAK